MPETASPAADPACVARFATEHKQLLGSAGLLPRFAGRVALVPPRLLLGHVGHRSRRARETRLLGCPALFLEFGFAGQREGEFRLLAFATLVLLVLPLLLQQSLAIGLPGEARVVDRLALGRDGLPARIVGARPGAEFFDKGHLGRGGILYAV